MWYKNTSIELRAQSSGGCMVMMSSDWITGCLQSLQERFVTGVDYSRLRFDIKTCCSFLGTGNPRLMSDSTSVVGRRNPS